MNHHVPDRRYSSHRMENPIRNDEILPQEIQIDSSLVPVPFLMMSICGTPSLVAMLDILVSLIGLLPDIPCRFAPH